MRKFINLDVRTLTFCQLVGFPLNHEKLVTFSRGADFATEVWHGAKMGSPVKVLTYIPHFLF